MIGAADLSPVDRKRGINAIMIGQFFVMGGFSMVIPLMAVPDVNTLGRDGNPAIPWLVYGSVAVGSSLGLWIMRGQPGAVREDAGKPANATVETTDGG